MLKNYLKVAWRNIWRNKIFTLINIIGLSLGISVCLVIFLLIRFESSYDTFHVDKERVYRLYITMDFGHQVWKVPAAPAPMGLQVTQDISGIESSAAFHTLRFSKIQAGVGKAMREFKPENQTHIVAQSSYFDIFRYEWLVGNAKTALEQPFQVVLTDKAAKKYFPQQKIPAIYGQKLRYVNDTDTVEVTVSGVVKAWQQNTDIVFTDIISFPTLKSKWKNNINLNSWVSTSSHSQLWIKLHKQQDVQKMTQKLQTYLDDKRDVKRNPRDKMQVGLQPFDDIHFNTDINADYGRNISPSILQVLVGVALLILLIACINFINLSTAQATQRAKEVGIRKSLGSTRWQLIGQFMTETFLIIVLAVLFTWFFLQQMLEVLQMFLPNSTTITYSWFDALLVSSIMILVATPLAGFYPAFMLTRFEPAQTLRNHILRGTSRKAYLRKFLIVFQFMASQTFVIFLLIVYGQTSYMLQKDMGFQKDNVLYFHAPLGLKQDKRQVLLQALKTLPTVKQICLSGGAPAIDNINTNDMKYKNTTLQVHQKFGDEQYMDFYGLKLLAGKNIVKSDSVIEFVVNETFVKDFGLKSPQKALGKFVMQEGKSYPIVGVVADFHVMSLHQKIPPVALSSINWINTFSLKVKDRQTIQEVEKIWKKHYPQFPFEYYFLDKTIEKFYEDELKLSKLISFCVLMAMFISCIGLFGLSIFTTTQRTKEIGIRKIHGASIQNIMVMLSRDFLKLIVWAFVLAAPIAYWLGEKFLANYSFKVSISWWMFIVTGLVSVMIALLTISFHTFRVARGNPVNALRSE